MTCPDDYNVILLDMPGDVLAAVRVDCNGYPTIYVNNQLSEPARRQAVAHELAHIAGDDFGNHLTIYDAEKRAVRESRVKMYTRSERRLTPLESIRLARLGDALHAHTFKTVYDWMPYQLIP